MLVTRHCDGLCSLMRSRGRSEDARHTITLKPASSSIHIESCRVPTRKETITCVITHSAHRAIVKALHVVYKTSISGCALSFLQLQVCTVNVGRGHASLHCTDRGQCCKILYYTVQTLRSWGSLERTTVGRIFCSNWANSSPIEDWRNTIVALSMHKIKCLFVSCFSIHI